MLDSPAHGRLLEVDAGADTSLAADSASLRRRFGRFAFKHNLYRLREERDMKPSTFGELVSSTLYEKRCGQGLVLPATGLWR